MRKEGFGGNRVRFYRSTSASLLAHDRQWKIVCRLLKEK